MSIRAETATIIEVSRLRTYLVSQSSIDAILHLLEGCGIGHVIDARCIGDHLLLHFLRAQKTRDYAKLRYVRPNCLAGIAPTKQKSRRDIAMAISRARVIGHP